ncbi:acyltransferase family protein [Ancylobacter moscoviensis]
MALSYRADIDGLRAVAVLAVLFFHAGVAAVPGGYVGVDVFFVISGYLITAILRREAESGAWSIARFYERRIRRILPALIVMSAVTVLLAGVFLLPTMNRDVPKQAMAALGFVANIYFWLTSDYFAAAAETKPFLHTWSLGVEEQFYLFMPLVMLAVAGWGRRRQIVVLSALAALSLGLCVALTPRHPEASFYLLPMRAWELLAGGLLGYLPSGGRPRWLDEMLASAGLLMLAGAIFLFDDTTPFPGYAAILPVLGAALLIRAAPGTWVGRFLSARAMVGIGLISYSLYLWHWPITVFARSGAVDLGRAAPAIILGLSLLLGYLSWRFIEQPFRDRTAMPTRRLLAATAVGVVAVLAAGGVLRAARGNLGGLDAQQIAFDRARYDISPLRLDCHIASGIGRPGGYCTRGDGTKGEVTVWADSHGIELSSALADLGYRVTMITYSACPPALGYAPAPRPDCRAHNDRVLAELSAGNGGPVVLAAHYRVLPPEALAGIVATANALAERGREVVLMGPMPSPGYDVPTHLAFGRGARFRAADDGFEALLAGLDPRVRVLRPADVFCQDGECSMLAEGKPLLFDDNHPSLTAARLLAARLPDAAVAERQ